MYLLQELEVKIQEAQVECRQLTVANEKLQKFIDSKQDSFASEMHQVQNLHSLNQLLDSELREANQKNMELVYKIEKLEKELKEPKENLDRETKLIESMRNKMQKLLKEKELAVLKKSGLKKQCEEMSALNQKLQDTLHQVEKEKNDMFQNFKNLSEEYENFQRQMQQDQEKASFRNFVALKRDLATIKNENEILRLKMKSVSDSLPLLKDDLPRLTAPVPKKGKKKLLALNFIQGSRSPGSD